MLFYVENGKKLRMNRHVSEPLKVDGTAKKTAAAPAKKRRKKTVRSLVANPQEEETPFDGWNLELNADGELVIAEEKPKPARRARKKAAGTEVTEVTTPKETGMPMTTETDLTDANAINAAVPRADNTLISDAPAAAVNGALARLATATAVATQPAAAPLTVATSKEGQSTILASLAGMIAAKQALDPNNAVHGEIVRRQQEEADAALVAALPTDAAADAAAALAALNQPLSAPSITVPPLVVVGRPFSIDPLSPTPAAAQVEGAVGEKIAEVLAVKIVETPAEPSDAAARAAIEQGTLHVHGLIARNEGLAGVSAAQEGDEKLNTEIAEVADLIRGVMDDTPEPATPQDEPANEDPLLDRIVDAADSLGLMVSRIDMPVATPPAPPTETEILKQHVELLVDIHNMEYLQALGESDFTSRISAVQAETAAFQKEHIAVLQRFNEENPINSLRGYVAAVAARARQENPGDNFSLEFIEDVIAAHEAAAAATRPAETETPAATPYDVSTFSFLRPQQRDELRELVSVINFLTELPAEAPLRAHLDFVTAQSAGKEGEPRLKTLRASVGFALRPDRPLADLRASLPLLDALDEHDAQAAAEAMARLQDEAVAENMRQDETLRIMNENLAAAEAEAADRAKAAAQPVVTDDGPLLTELARLMAAADSQPVSQPRRTADPQIATTAAPTVAEGSQWLKDLLMENPEARTRTLLVLKGYVEMQLKSLEFAEKYSALPGAAQAEVRPDLEKFVANLRAFETENSTVLQTFGAQHPNLGALTDRPAIEAYRDAVVAFVRMFDPADPFIAQFTPAAAATPPAAAQPPAAPAAAPALAPVSWAPNMAPRPQAPAPAGLNIVSVTPNIVMDRSAAPPVAPTALTPVDTTSRPAGVSITVTHQGAPAQPPVAAETPFAPSHEEEKTLRLYARLVLAAARDESLQDHVTEFEQKHGELINQFKAANNITDTAGLLAALKLDKDGNRIKPADANPAAPPAPPEAEQAPPPAPVAADETPRQFSVAELESVSTHMRNRNKVRRLRHDAHFATTGARDVLQAKLAKAIENAAAFYGAHKEVLHAFWHQHVLGSADTVVQLKLAEMRAAATQPSLPPVIDHAVPPVIDPVAVPPTEDRHTRVLPATGTPDSFFRRVADGLTSAVKNGWRAVRPTATATAAAAPVTPSAPPVTPVVPPAPASATPPAAPAAIVLSAEEILALRVYRQFLGLMLPNDITNGRAGLIDTMKRNETLDQYTMIEDVIKTATARLLEKTGLSFTGSSYADNIATFHAAMKQEFGFEAPKRMTARDHAQRFWNHIYPARVKRELAAEGWVAPVAPPEAAATEPVRVSPSERRALRARDRAAAAEHA